MEESYKINVEKRDTLHRVGHSAKTAQMLHVSFNLQVTVLTVGQV